MESRPHGDYQIELIDNVVHVFPVGGFNEEGITQLHKEIAFIAPQNKPWALFEHPQNAAGLTPEAIEQLFTSYKNLHKLNCVVICLEISSTWQSVIEKSLLGKVNIPVYLSNDVAKLEQFIKQELAVCNNLSSDYDVIL